MTGNEILEYVEKRLKRNIDPADVIEAINEGLDAIAVDSLLYDTIDVTVTDGNQWYNLPRNFTFIEKVIKDENIIYARWDYRNGEIRFLDEGHYKIVARKMPEHLTNITDSLLDLHKLYHNAIKYYALAWVKENDNFEDQGAKELYQRAEIVAKIAAQKLLSTKAPSKVRVQRHA